MSWRSYRDISIDTENFIINEGVISCDLKVAHHGSNILR